MAVKEQEKQERLEAYLKQLGSVLLAYSGGVDSTYLMHEAHKVLGDKAMAVTMSLASVPEREIEDARNQAEEEGIRYEVIKLNQFLIKGFASNPPDRCYICKKALFSHLVEKARKEGFAAVIDGTNENDIHEYRPGLRALAELGIKSPLRQAGLTKQDIRVLSKEAGLPTWSKPSFACMATRFPYNEEITPEKLKRLEKAEQYLYDHDFAQFRVRTHGDLARIEVPVSDLPKIMALREGIVKAFKQYGYTYVSLDLEGYRSGSMDEEREKQEQS